MLIPTILVTAFVLLMICVFIYYQATQSMIAQLKSDVRNAESRCVQLEGQIFVQGQHFKHSSELYQNRTQKTKLENEYMYEQLQKAKAAGFIPDVMVEEDKPKPTLRECIMNNRLERIRQGKRTPTHDDLEYIRILVKQGIISEKEYGLYKMERSLLPSEPIPPKTRVVSDDDSLSRKIRKDSRGAGSTREISDVLGASMPFYTVAATSYGSPYKSSGSSRADDGSSSGDSSSYGDSGSSSD